MTSFKPDFAVVPFDEYGFVLVTIDPKAPHAEQLVRQTLNEGFTESTEVPHGSPDGWRTFIKHTNTGDAI